MLTQDQVLETILPQYEGFPGIAYWAGHGNDPYMYSLDTTKKVLDGANGKQYYRTIEADITRVATKLPLTVSGDVAWVAAQTSPKHLRLTLTSS